MPQAFRFSYSPPAHEGTSGLPGGQRRLIELALRHRVVVAIPGRRWGKTTGAEMLICEEWARWRRGVYRVGYATPTLKLARKRFKSLRRLFMRGGLHVEASVQDLTLTVRDHPALCDLTISFWGMVEAENVRGEGLDRLIIDECKDVPHRAYASVLRPMLLETGGKTLLIGTASRIGVGAAWFRAVYLKAKGGAEGHAYFHAPSTGAPHLDQAAIAALIRDVEDEGGSVREEIFSEWLEDEGAIFERLKATFSVPILRTEKLGPGITLWVGEDPDRGVTASDPLHPGREPHDYCIGFDLALLRDYSVAAVFNRTTRDMAALLRMHKTRDDVQRNLVHSLHKRYHDAQVFWDRTGMGTAWAGEMGRLLGTYGVPVVWNAQSKLADLRRAATLCQRAGTPEGWALIEVPWLYSEFESYQVVTRDSLDRSLATPKMGAPPGLHDDGVSACMLASPSLLSARVPEVTTARARLFGPGWAMEQFERELRSAR